ncbi:MAG: hypothetical protein ACTHMP_07230 [Thermomicrobiales bacterium]
MHRSRTRRLLSLAGLLLGVLLLAMPSLTAAAPNPAQPPAVGIVPGTGPNGFWFSYAAVGLTPNTGYNIQVVDAAGDAIPIQGNPVQSDADGLRFGSLSFNNLATGTATLSLVTTAGTTVASTPFQIGGGTPAPVLGAVPSSIQPGYWVAFPLSALTPGGQYTLAIKDPAGQAIALSQPSFQADSNGTGSVAVPLDANRPTGNYTVTVSGPNGQQLQTTFGVGTAAQPAPATTPTTVTGAPTAVPGAATAVPGGPIAAPVSPTPVPVATRGTSTTAPVVPGMPPAGEGGMSGSGAALTLALVGGALLALAGLALARRRDAA